MVMRLLGLTICLLVLFEMVFARRYGVRLPEWAGWAIGLVSGSLSGAFNIGGPPLVAFIYDRPWSKDEQVATLNGLFIVTGLIRLALLIAYDHLNAATWTSAAWAAAPMLAAILCGTWLLRFIPQQWLRTAIYLALLVLWLRYLIAGA